MAVASAASTMGAGHGGGSISSMVASTTYEMSKSGVWRRGGNSGLASAGDPVKDTLESFCTIDWAHARILSENKRLGGDGQH